MTFLVGCIAVVGFISYRCWFFVRIDRPRPRGPVIDRVKEYEAMEEMAVEIIRLNSQSENQIRERLEQFYLDYPPPDMQQRLKRELP